jgi:hypothetical protein
MALRSGTKLGPYEILSPLGLDCYRGIHGKIKDQAGGVWFFRKLLISVGSKRAGSSERDSKKGGKLCPFSVEPMEAASRPSRVVKSGVFEVSLY